MVTNTIMQTYQYNTINSAYLCDIRIKNKLTLISISHRFLARRLFSGVKCLLFLSKFNSPVLQAASIISGLPFTKPCFVYYLCAKSNRKLL